MICTLIEQARSDAMEVLRKKKIETENNANDIALNDMYDEQKKQAKEKLNKNKRDRALANNHKPVVFLLYTNRYSDEFPLIFDNECEQVFVDVLLPSDDEKVEAIVINDVNIYDDNCSNTLNLRVLSQKSSLTLMSFEQVMIHIKLSTAEQSASIDEIKLLLLNSKDNTIDNEMFASVLKNTIISSIINSKKNFGAANNGSPNETNNNNGNGSSSENNCILECLSKGLQDKQLLKRGSLRAYMMEQTKDKNKT